MFQDFSAPADPVTGDERLSRLRRRMADDRLDALLVPHADEQNNEYLPEDKERLAWLTGFTGSAGSALVACERAVLFVDGRYTLQAAQQADTNHWEVDSLVDNPPHKWLETEGQNGWRVGIDPWLHTADQVKQLKNSTERFGGELVFLKSNPVDAVWNDRPAPPKGDVRIHDFRLAGRTTGDKMDEIRATLVEKNADAVVLTDPASVCWLFNIRGADVAHTPIALAHAIVPTDGEPIVFLDREKLDMETRAFLTQVCTMCEPHELTDKLKSVAQNAKIMLDPASAAFAFTQLVEDAGGSVVAARDPVSLPRAVKNSVELEGTRAAHLRDGAAMATFLCWIDQQQPGTIDEIMAAKKLEEVRREMAGDMSLKDISFDTISGSGPNGAIVHYRVNEESNRTLHDGELYLSDSGGQYADGTTDITRTVAIGNVGDDERRCFTLVLKGHIAIAAARFPTGTRGMDLDPLARIALWKAGLDYGHGTGHGVGSYLAVHEGPQNISRRGAVAMQPGMIVSNEPGYYRTGDFGIRIENLVVVEKAQQIDGGDIPMMGFETITLVPIDLRLVDADLLTSEERDWLNAYHTRVQDALAPLVDSHVRDWLSEATRSI